MLSQHPHQSESPWWAAQRQEHPPHQQIYPAYPSANNNSSDHLFDYDEEDDDNDSDNDSICDSIFSHSPRSRRSSVSSVASEAGEAAAAPAFDQPRDLNGAPITTYASLDQAVAQSTQSVEAQGPRRLVTPGKLYENEEDDDEIVEMDGPEDGDTERQRQQQYSDQDQFQRYRYHHEGGLSTAAASATTAAAVG
ncbi:hypothetical protein AAE478_006642 [Parahypoxylon ruwenzoriense]